VVEAEEEVESGRWWEPMRGKATTRLVDVDEVSSGGRRWSSRQGNRKI
jgi:hypothetical protein